MDPKFGASGQLRKSGKIWCVKSVPIRSCVKQHFSMAEGEWGGGKLWLPGNTPEV